MTNEERPFPLVLGAWALVIDWSLGFGNWGFGSGAPRRSLPPSAGPGQARKVAPAAWAGGSRAIFSPPTPEAPHSPHRLLVDARHRPRPPRAAGRRRRAGVPPLRLFPPRAGRRRGVPGMWPAGPVLARAGPRAAPRAAAVAPAVVRRHVAGARRPRRRAAALSGAGALPAARAVRTRRDRVLAAAGGRSRRPRRGRVAAHPAARPLRPAGASHALRRPRRRALPARPGTRRLRPDRLGPAVADAVLHRLLLAPARHPAGPAPAPPCHARAERAPREAMRRDRRG